MTFTVYHARRGFGHEATTFPDDFERVADVETDEIGEVFQLTNHIDSSWTENPGVTATPGGKRSTSVGDVIVTSQGTLVAIAPIGLVWIGPSVTTPALVIPNLYNL